MAGLENRLRKFLVCFVLAFSAIGSVLAQNDYQLALQYYNNREFEKSASLLEILLQKNVNETYLRYYLNSLVEQKKFSETEKAIKYYSRKLGNSPTFKVEIGQIFKIMGQTKESDKFFRDAISDALTDRNVAVSVANRFIGIREFQWAERTYLEASKKIKGASFEQELANVYYYTRNYGEMVNIYLDLLAQSDAFLQMVQNRLYSAIYSDTDKSLTDIVEEKLLQKIQQYPNNGVFNEMLIWIYIQQSNFSAAYIQARALDLRNNEQGTRLLPLAQAAAQSKDFETAVKAYNNILELGEYSPLYLSAYTEKLDILFIKIKNGIDFTPETISQTIESYRVAIEKFGYKVEMLSTILKYIELLSLYRDPPDEALMVIDKAINIRGLTAVDKANIELLRADVMVIQDKLWDAALIYAKIERTNSQHPVGFEAKFRKVKMALYQNDYEWAKSQIDVLKASTAKLISNDAIEMSILLYEGWSDSDSTQRPLKLYTSALLKHAQKRPETVFQYIDSLTVTGHSFLSVEALNLKAKILVEKSLIKEAAEVYELILKNYMDETNTDRSLFQLGVLHLNFLNDGEKAIQLFTQLLQNYPSSVFCVEARQLIQKARQKPAQ